MTNLFILELKQKESPLRNHTTIMSMTEINKGANQIINKNLFK